MSSRPFVSVIIPTYNREQELIDTITSVVACAYPKDCREIVIVDQTVRHNEEVRSFLVGLERRGELRWYRPPEISFASLTKARNYGILKAHSPTYILFVDDDVLVEPDFIERHVAAFTDKAVGAVVGRVIVPGLKVVAATAPVGRISWMGAFIDNYSSERPQDAFNFIGCNFSLRASVLPRTGGFEELFMGNALREDSDMAVRVIKAGFRIRFVPEAKLIHRQAVTGGTRSQTDRIRWYSALFYNNFLFYGRWAPAVWRVPFFVLHMWRPILVCSFWYGRGRPSALLAPWRGMRDGLRAARQSLSRERRRG